MLKTETYESYIIRKTILEMDSETFGLIVDDFITIEASIINSEDFTLDNLDENEIQLYSDIIDFIILNERAGGSGSTVKTKIFSKVAGKLKDIGKKAAETAKKASAVAKDKTQRLGGNLSTTYSNIKKKTDNKDKFKPVRKKFSKRRLALIGGAAAVGAYAHRDKFHTSKHTMKHKDTVESRNEEIFIDAVIERMLKELYDMRYILEYEKFKEVSSFKDDMKTVITDIQKIGNIKHEIINNDSRKFVILTDDMVLAQEVYDTLVTNKEQYKIKTVEIEDVNKVYVSLMNPEELEKEKERIIKDRKEKEEMQKMMTGMVVPEPGADPQTQQNLQQTT